MLPGKNELQSGGILGVFTPDGLVESRFVADYSWACHDDTWPSAWNTRWRFTVRRGEIFAFCDHIDEATKEKIRQHITKKYGIPFQENGYVDTEWFTKR